MGEVGPIAFKYWVEFLFGSLFSLLTAAFVAGFRWVRKKFKEAKVEQDTVKKGIQALLRDRIIQACNHYEEKGCCPIYGLENVLAMHKEYQALGGNGAVEQLVDDLKQMPRPKKERIQPMEESRHGDMETKAE